MAALINRDVGVETMVAFYTINTSREYLFQQLPDPHNFVLKRVLVADGKNLIKVVGSTPRGVRCVKKRPVSDLVLTATTIKNGQDAVSYVLYIMYKKIVSRMV